MYLHVNPSNQERFHGVIGFEKPMAAFPGDLKVMAPRHVRAMDEYLSLPNNSRFTRGMSIPIIHFDTDDKYRFTTAGWGHRDTEKGYWEYVRRHDKSSTNPHVAICASYFDVMFDAPKKNRSIGIRLRSADGGPLYIGARYWLTRERFIEAVVPFVSEAGAHVAPYSDWQPVFIPQEYLLDYLSNALPRDHELSTLRVNLRIEVLSAPKKSRTKGGQRTHLRHEWLDAGSHI